MGNGVGLVNDISEPSRRDEALACTCLESHCEASWRSVAQGVQVERDVGRVVRSD